MTIDAANRQFLVVAALSMACSSSPTDGQRGPAPDAPAVSATIPFASTGEDPSCTAEAGPGVQILWRWSINDTPTDVTGNSFPRAQLLPESKLTCVATPVRNGVPGEPGSATVDIEGPGGNVLILLADDMGVDKVGVYGAHPSPPPTPNIDALAEEGVLFRRAYNMSVCSAARATMLTGRLPSRHGMGWWIDVNFDTWNLADGEITIPEMLEASRFFDYRNIAIGKWHLSTPSYEAPGRHPLDQGFDVHMGSLDNPNVALFPDQQSRGYYHWEKWINGEPSFSDTYMTTDTVNDARDVLSETPEPWFAWVAFNAPHSPWHNPPGALHSQPLAPGSGPIVQMDAMVEALDTEIGRLLDEIDPDVRRRTTVIFVADNGTVQNVITPPLDALRGKGTNYDGGILVPMIVAGPVVSNPGREVNDLVHAVDFLPTVAEIAGVDLADVDVSYADELVLDGKSFLPLLRNPNAPPHRDVLFTENLRENGPPPWQHRASVAIENDFKFVARPLEGRQFFDYREGEWDEGPDLLLDDVSLTDEQSEAVERLVNGLNDFDESLMFDW